MCKIVKIEERKTESEKKNVEKGMMCEKTKNRERKKRKERQR